MLGVGMSDKMAFIVDTKARRRFLSELILQIFTLFLVCLNSNFNQRYTKERKRKNKKEYLHLQKVLILFSVSILKTGIFNI